MVGSSWGQIDDTLRGEIEEYNTAIIVSKLAILGSVRRLAPKPPQVQDIAKAAD